MLQLLGSETTWDAFVANHPHGDLLQTSAWAEVKSSAMESHQIAVWEDGRMSAGAQMFIRRIGPLAGFAYVPYGPVGFADDVVPLVERLESQARRAGAHVLLIQPPRRAHDHEPILTELGYRRARMDVTGSATIEKPVQCSDEQLEASMTGARRRNLRTARRAGVTVRQGDEDDLTVFRSLHEMSAARNGFVPMSADYLARQWRALAPRGHLALFIAEHDGEPEAAALVTAFRDRAEFKLTGWVGGVESSRRCPNDAIQWELFLWARQRGFAIFDVGGIDRSHAIRIVEAGGLPDDLRSSGSMFKMAAGGEAVVYPPTYERVLAPIGHLTYGVPARFLSEDGLGSVIVNRLRRR